MSRRKRDTLLERAKDGAGCPEAAGLPLLGRSDARERSERSLERRRENQGWFSLRKKTRRNLHESRFLNSADCELANNQTLSACHKITHSA